MSTDFFAKLAVTFLCSGALCLFLAMLTEDWYLRSGVRKLIHNLIASSAATCVVGAVISVLFMIWR
jgi:hypothetical protein